ncbi:magnesium transporter [Arthrobacter sp. NIO-1057]|uniref:magnesium transporter n=1 Tax=Arthrobacter sp. NIO-1057 TaxID=993071 RepID=UPI00071D4B66|nr:magnesium transporter [Arthrobacter sp. NIO-1057]KSU64950.1 magnesium transporter [Arthrobacter sp. NIO-1057]SCC49833.1 magnesium transporter [Arthrobacter sp. NIO-1057]
MFTFEQVDFSTTSLEIRSRLANEDFQPLATLLRSLDLGQLIKQIEALKTTDAAILYRLLDKDRALEVFQDLDSVVQAELVESLQQEAVVDAFDALEPADRVALLDELPATVASQLLVGLDAHQRHATGVLLGYQDSSVGRVMSPHVITTQPDFTVAQTLERITPQLGATEHGHIIMVVDSTRRFLGALRLSDLLGQPGNQRVSAISKELPTAQAAESDIQAARRAVDRHLDLMPVLDNEGRLIGALPLSDAIDLLENAEESRTARSAGTEPLYRPYLGTPLRKLVRARIIWLLVLAIGATLTVKVLAAFEQTLESMVVLSLFIPLIVGIGGNTGNQAATTVTRALAMGDVRVRDLGRVIFREVRIGAMLGLCLGTIALIIASVAFELKVGLIIGMTLIVLCAVAAAVGGAMPIIGKFFKADPAVFSNPFISTFVDAAGLVVYLSVAVIVLGQ